MTETLGRFMKASQAAGFDALRIRGAVIASKLDALWEGNVNPDTSTPTEKMPKFYAGEDPVVHLRRLSDWIDSEVSIGGSLGELKDEMTDFKGECIGLAFWIEGRL